MQGVETIGVKTYQFHAKGYFRHHVKLNCFKDDNVKVVFASTLNVFLLVIKFYSLVYLTTTLSGIFNPRPKLSLNLLYQNGAQS